MKWTFGADCDKETELIDYCVQAELIVELRNDLGVTDVHILDGSNLLTFIVQPLDENERPIGEPLTVSTDQITDVYLY